MKVRERIKITIKNSEHYVGIIELTETSATIGVFSKPQEKKLSVGEEWKVDVNEDGYYDIYIKLNSILGSNLTLSFKQISEAYQIIDDYVADKPEIEIEDDEEIKRNLLWLWIVLGVVFGIIVVFVFISRKSFKKYFRKR